MWQVVKWIGEIIQVYANSMGRKKEKKKKKKKERFNSFLAASWQRISLIPVLKPHSPVVVSAMQHLNSFILKVAVFHG